MKNFKNKIKSAGKIFYWIFVVLLVLIAGLTAISGFKIPGSYRLLVVQSGSMTPKIRAGSIIAVKPAVEYKKGDIITIDINNKRSCLTHRIYDIKEKEGKSFFITKGDANDSPDTEEIVKERVFGKMIFALPLLGYPVNFAKTQLGLIVLIIIPVIIIIYSELINIKNEAQRLLKERKKRLTIKEKIEVEIGEEEIKIEKGLKRFWRRFKEKIKRTRK